MDLYELLDLVASQWNKIDSVWNFFLWIHLTILGALMIVDRHVSVVERTIAMLIYIGFLVINYQGMVAAYGYFEALILQVREYPNPENADYVLTFLTRMPARLSPTLINAIYLLGVVLTGAALVLVNRFVDAKLRLRAEFQAMWHRDI
ncbi:MAG: hypothetical protein ACFB6R_13735 [Alphaproteobacteria bacterium]